MINTQKQKNKCLQHKLNMKKVNENLSSKLAVTILEIMLPPKIVKFVESQMNFHAKKRKGRRYSNETIAFVLSLYQLSGT